MIKENQMDDLMLPELPPMGYGNIGYSEYKMREYAKKAVEADRAARDFCHHDETERLGAIWTRCNQCGKKWADDEPPLD